MDKLLNFLIMILILKFYSNSNLQLNELPQVNKQIKNRVLDSSLSENNSIDLQKKLCNVKNYYHWKSTQRPYNFFQNNQGDSISQFYHKEYIDGKLPSSDSNTIYVVVFDPKYLDRKNIQFEFPLQIFYNQQKQQWNGTVLVNFSLFDHYNFINSYIQNITFLINQTYCIFTFSNFTLQFISEKAPEYNNLPWIMIIPPILIFLAIIKYSFSSSPPQSISVLTICIILNFLIVVGLLQLALGVGNMSGFRNIWLIPSFITLSLIFRIGQVFQQTLKKISGFFGYIKFYLLSGVYMLLFISFILQNWFILVNTLWLLPQIILNVERGVKYKFNYWYILIVAIPQFYVIYVKGYSQNIFRKAPEPSICFLIILIYCLQILVLLGQSIYGSRFFIPKRFLPNYYQYRFQLEINPNKDFIVPDCAICLISLQHEDTNEVNLEKISEDRKQIKKVTVLNTPCGHKFHIKCLQDWMQLKLECPIDRSVLPIYQ